MANTTNDRHPATATLLDYLDNSCSSEDSAHIQQCVSCLNEVLQISESRSRLQQLPQVQAPAHLWANIQQELQPSEKKIKPAGHQYQWFALAASILIVISLVLVNPLQQPVQRQPSESDSEYLALLQESQQLESSLSYLDRQPTIINLSTAGRVSQYRDSITAIDLALSEHNPDNINDEFKNSLMKERIRLLRRLVQARATPLVSQYKTF